MRVFTGAMAAGVCVFAASGASAAPSVDIDHAVARVFVSPEPRSDIKVEILKANPSLPLHISTLFGHVRIDGGFAARRTRDCHGPVTQPSVYVDGIGEVGADAMPRIVIHTPMDAHINAGGAVFGQIGRTNSLELTNAGCGEWRVGNVRGRLKVSVAGSGETRTGQAGAADLTAAGSGAIITREIAGPVTATNVGSGDIEIASVQGPFSARIAGSGHVRVAAGHASAMSASIAGSGDIALLGVADSLKASVLGSGDVRVSRVTGAISKAVVGSGRVRVGS